MRKIYNYSLRNFFKYATVVFILALTSCNQIFDVYTNPKLSSYNIHKIALLPMVWDDTTEEGTFYSTNHFINKIYNEREGIELADIDSLRKLNCDTVVTMFDKIGDRNEINLDSIFASPIGSYLNYERCDAILVGTIDSAWVHERNTVSDHSEWASMYCRFNYYLFSLRDGNLLWRIRVQGSDDNYVSLDNAVFPPLDESISSGIDFFFDLFPFKKKEVINQPW